MSKHAILDRLGEHSVKSIQTRNLSGTSVTADNAVKSTIVLEK
jgi:hypothetical protein